jgi:hypothetical protein
VQPQTFIVQCGICSQPWQVPTIQLSTPGHWLLLPDHFMLDRSTSQPIAGVPCPGPQLPGLGIGKRADWERNWPLSHIGRPLPAVLDGAGIGVVG